MLAHRVRFFSIFRYQHNSARARARRARAPHALAGSGIHLKQSDYNARTRFPYTPAVSRTRNRAAVRRVCVLSIQRERLKSRADRQSDTQRRRHRQSPGRYGGERTHTRANSEQEFLPAAPFTHTHTVRFSRRARVVVVVSAPQPFMLRL